jgi:hypothetical protein
MKADTSWVAPDAVRLARAKIAAQIYSFAVWSPTKLFCGAMDLGSRAAWVQELWAQVADAALLGENASAGAKLAHSARIVLEGRDLLGESWEKASPLERQIWLRVALALRDDGETPA